MKLTNDRKEHIRNVFESDAKVLLSEVEAYINKLEKKYLCIKRERIANYIKQRIK
jgi:hypothetical protein